MKEAYSTGRVEEGNLEFVVCRFKECQERGELISCYFDFYKQCPAYKQHKRIARQLKNMEMELRYHGIFEDGKKSTKRT